MVSNIKNFVYFALFILLSTTVYAADLMSFTANVKDGSGNNFGAGDVVVEIYDAASGGNLIYNSTNDFLRNVSNGQIDIMLGSGVQQLNLAYGSDYYMEVYLNRTELDFQGQERQRFQAGIGNVTLNKVNVSTSLVPTTNSTLNLGQSSNGWWNNIFGVTGYFLSKVGIGTTSPTVALNVTGDVGVTGTVTATSFVGDGSGLTGLDSSTYNATYDQWSYNQTTGAINYITSGGALTSIQGNNTYIKTGGALISYSNIALTNQSTTFTLNLTTSDTLTATNSLNVNSGKLIVTQTGNVGIGTTSPSSALNVTGDIGVTGTVTATSFIGSGTGLTGISGMSYTNLALTNQSNVFSGNVTIANNLTVKNAAEITFNLTVIDSILTDFIYPESSGNIALKGGKVLIGTENTNGTLNVGSETDPSIVINPGTSTTVDSRIYFRDTSDGAGFQILYDNDGGDTFFDNKWDNDGGDIFFRLKTDGAPINILTLKGSGNVGIGTTAPGAKFHVLGSLIVQNSTNSLWGSEVNGPVANMPDLDTQATTIEQTGSVNVTHNRIFRATGDVTISQNIQVLPQAGQTRGSYPITHGAPGVELGAIMAALGSKGIPLTMKPGGGSNTSNGGIIQILAKGNVAINAQINASGNYSGTDGGGGGGLVVIVSNGTISGSGAITVAGAAGGATAAVRGGGGGYSGEPGGHAGYGGSAGGGASGYFGGGTAGSGFISGKGGGGASGLDCGSAAGGGGGGSLDTAGSSNSAGTGGAGGAGDSTLSFYGLETVTGWKARATVSTSSSGSAGTGTGGAGGTNGGGGGGGGTGGAGGNAAALSGSGGGGAGKNAGCTAVNGGNGGSGGPNLYTLSSNSVYAGLPGGQGGGGGGATSDGGTGGSGGSGASGITPFVSAMGAGAGGAGAAGTSGTQTGGNGGAGGNGGGAAGMVIMIAPSVTYSGTVTGKLIIIEGNQAAEFIRGYYLD